MSPNPHRHTAPDPGAGRAATPPGLCADPEALHTGPHAGPGAAPPDDTPPSGPDARDETLPETLADARPAPRAGTGAGFREMPAAFLRPAPRTRPRPGPPAASPADPSARAPDLQRDAAALRGAHAAGRLDEPALLDRLAVLMGLDRADLRMAPPDPALADLLDPAFCLRHQLLPWRRTGDTLVFASARPEAFAALLPDLARRLPRDERAAPRLVVVPRGQVQGAVAAHHRATLGRRMTTRVPLGESCRGWHGSGLRLALTGSVVALGAGLVALFPLAAFTGLTLWALLTLVLAMVLKTLAAARCLARPPADPLAAAAMPAPMTAPVTAPITTPGTAPLAPAMPAAPAMAPARPGADPAPDLPVISVLVPLFRERRMAAALLDRLQRLDYPRERLEVVLVLEEADHVTRDTLASLAMPPWMRSVVVPAGTPQTKPRAMNYALDFCRGDIIGVYDAEDAPDPDQLRKVAARFAVAPRRTACLQGALDYYNPRQTWLARCFTIEYNTWFRLVLPGIAGLGFPVPLGGTTLFVRRDVLEALGGWDAHNVTEDADLGIRLARHGYRTELLDTTTGEEATCHLRPWIRQRSRWLKGYIVTYLVHLRRPGLLHRQLGPWRSAGFHAHFITAVSQFILAPFLWSFWLILAGLPHPLVPLVPPVLLHACAGLFLCAELQNLALGFIATSRAPHRHLRPWLPTLHFYYPLGCIAAYRALYELVVRPFHWNKTRHGHSLTAPQDPPG